MINTDGKTTIANAGADEFLRKALEAGGHLGDDVAWVVVDTVDESTGELYRTLTRDDPALD